MNKLLQPYFIREQVIRSIREFFFDQGFHEVIAPALNSALPVEPNIYPFSTKWVTSQETRELFMSTSPEAGIKKMIAKGIGNCFSLGKCFRNLEGSGSLHIPEFMMLEWYREDATYEKIMDDVKELVINVKKNVNIYLKLNESTIVEFQDMKFDLNENWEVFSMIELFKKYAGLNFEEILEDKMLFMKAQAKGYNTTGAKWSELFDQIFVNEIESQLPKTPFFIKDFPARLSPLCKVKKDQPHIADRFEVFMFGMELGNGNNENTDYQSVEKLFKKEHEERIKRGLLTQPIDYHFINALKVMSAKSYAGIGLGIDRLAMIMANVTSIQEIELLHP